MFVHMDVLSHFCYICLFYVYILPIPSYMRWVRGPMLTVTGLNQLLTIVIDFVPELIKFVPDRNHVSG